MTINKEIFLKEFKRQNKDDYSYYFLFQNNHLDLKKIDNVQITDLYKQVKDSHFVYEQYQQVPYIVSLDLLDTYKRYAVASGLNLIY